MNLLQRILKATYPWRMKFSNATGVGISKFQNQKKTMPQVSFYSLSATLNNGKTFDFETLRGKNVLIVNTASNCGFTGQYAELENLYQQHKQHLEILGFPANNFGGQEPGSDGDIAQFCQINYGVTFPIFKKASVKGSSMQPVFEWLCNPEKNGWNNQEAKWNFCKYLISKDGELTNFYSSSVSPLSSDVLNALL